MRARSIQRRAGVRKGQRLSWIALAIAWGAWATGCAAVPIRVAALDELEQVRLTESAKEGARRAPEMTARAEAERELGLHAHAAGDDVEASLHAERAIAAYGHALAIARLARATSELADAQKSLDDTVVQRQALDANRADLERQADGLARRAEVAAGRWLPAASAASPERDGARRTAARAMAAEARLLCSAARLVAAQADGLAQADAEIGTLGSKLDGASSGAAVDLAARTRAHCLDVLTRARRGVKDDGGPDVLLTELSEANGWAPSRDERGVVVTLRNAYRDDQLTDEATAKLKELGRVASTHPAFGVQVVVHDAVAPAAKEPGDGRDARRARAAVAALVAGGATEARVDSELAGARMPVADPADPQIRSRNERLDVVFVGP